MHRSLRNRVTATAAALALAAGATIMFAAPASADRVWHQSIGRSSADAACPTNTEAETAAGWTKWAPSWEKWANHDTGGYVCSRSIVWAKEGSPSTCLLVHVGPELYADFANGPIPPTARAFADPSCTSITIFKTNGWFVMAASLEEAQLTCTAGPGGVAAQWADRSPGVDPRVYVCLD